MIAVSFRTVRDREEAVLSAIAKVEMALRDQASKSALVSDQERQKGNHGNRAYWSGFAQGQRRSADLVSELYQRTLEAFRKP